MPLFAGVDITSADIPSWALVLVVFMLCVTRIAIAAMRADGPLMSAVTAAFMEWVRRRRQH